MALVIGCGGGTGGAKTTAVGNVADPGDTGVPPALFAALFVDGKEFVYEVRIETTSYDAADRPVRNATTVEISCGVRGMQNFTRAVAVRLECDEYGSNEPTPGGIWVATAAGIWRRDSFPLDDATIDALDPKAMILAAQPVERPDSGDAGSDDDGEAWFVERDTGGWCSIHTRGDGSGDSICFAWNKGLVRGAVSFPGGETKDVVYTLTP